jgi:hypothetical protein
MIRALASVILAVLALAIFADDADAQRRRRRRPRPRPETTEQAPAEPAPEETPAEEPVAQPVPAAPAQTPPADGAPAEPSTTPVETYDPGPAPPDVTPIRTDYVALMDDLVQARMRVAALGAELFRTRIRVELFDRTGDRVSLARCVVHVDGAPVFQTDAELTDAQNGREIFAGSLAPGPHVLTLEVEQRSPEDASYRYTLRESFRFQILRERLTEVTLVLEDGSDMARSFPSGGQGQYEVHTRMRVVTHNLPAGR